MKKICIIVIILSAGAICFCWSHQMTAATRRELVSQAAALAAQEQQSARLRIERQQLTERISITRELLSGLPQPAPADALMRKIVSGVSWNKLSAAEAERLLAELGFDWNTPGDYLFISKNSLDGISFKGLNGTRLTDAALETLAVMPEEKAVIEDMARRLQDKHATWVKENLQRGEPHDNVLAEYSLPADEGFSKNQMADFVSTLISTLGPQRSQWLQSHAADWMLDMGLREQPDISKIPAEYMADFLANFQRSQPTKLKVEQYQSGDAWRLNYTLEQQGNTMTTSVLPRQPFPEAFRAAFPGGWKDMAEREGFELPKEFDKK